MEYNTQSFYDSILNIPLYCDIPRRCQLIDCCILVSPPRQFLRRPSSPVVNVELANSLFIFASFVYYFGTSAPRRASTTSEINNNNDDAIDSSAGSVPLKGRAMVLIVRSWGSMRWCAGSRWMAMARFRLIFSFHLRQWQRNHYRPTFQYYSPWRKG
jgi:hypothetical protein